MANSFPYVQSYWTMNDSREATPALEGEHDTDVVVIGGGVAGLATGLGLLEQQPDLRVTLIEAQHIGYGASGRNGGVLMNMPPVGWLLEDLSDKERSANVRLASSMTTDRLEKMGALLQQENIDAEWTPTHLRIVARNFLEVASIRWSETLTRAAGLDARLYEGDEVADQIGRSARALLAFPVVTVQPYKLVRGMQTILMRRGGSVFEHTPAVAIDSNPKGVTVRTPRGVVRAEKAVLTTNAYINRTELALEVPVPKTKLFHTYLMATEQLSAEQLNQISPSRRPFADPSLSFMYGRIHDGRLLFGGIDRGTGNTLDDDRHERSFRKIHRTMVKRFPFLAEVPLVAAWGGAVQQNGSEAPIVRRAERHPNIVLNIGYGGSSGVGAGLLSGRLVPTLVLEQSDDHDAQRVVSLLERTRIPWMGPVRAATGVLSAMVRGRRPALAAG